ncbi:MAG TPA: AAA family ATPase [Gemmatimonadaceae bacterium]
MSVITLADVRPERVEWLWPGYVPFGYLTMLEGKGGIGKSTMMLDLAARLSTGAPLPGGARRGPFGTLLMMQEDGLEDVIRPRLDNAGADMSRVHALSTVVDEDGNEVYPALPDAVTEIERLMIQYDCRLLVIDPIMNYFAKGYSTGIDSEIRQVLMPLHEMCKRNRFAAVLMRHLNRRQGAEATDRGTGGSGFLNVARSALVVARDPDNPVQFAMAQSKTNLAGQSPTLLYALENCENGAARLAWGGVSRHDADALVQLSGSKEEMSELEEAVAFLRDLLAEGEMLAREAQRHARDAGIADRTLRRAREQLGIRIQKERSANGRSIWALPEDLHNPAQGGQGGYSENVGQVGQTETLQQLGQHVQGAIYTPGGQVPNGQVGQVRQVPRVPFAGVHPCSRCGVDVAFARGAVALCSECLQARVVAD